MKTNASMTRELEYRADLDGLRAVAVLSVVAYHVHAPYITGGFVGVDVFFVLSGYLITGIILSKLNKGSFSLIGFYDRRIRRIVPALVVVLAASTATGAIIMTPADFSAFAVTVIGAALSANNFIFWQSTDYFQPTSELLPLLHTWTLAVEEQFYFLFPIIYMVVFRWGRRVFAAFIWLSLFASLALSIIMLDRAAAATFYVLPTRAWELLIGAALTVTPMLPARFSRLREVAAASGLILIFGSIFLYSNDTPFPGLAALPPCVGAGLVIWAGLGGHGRSTLAGRLLSHPAAVFIGLISYSLYLWHWPLLSFARYWLVRPLTPLEAGVIVIAAIGLSAASWRYVEAPLRRGVKPWPTVRQRYALGLGALAGMALLGGVIRQMDGLPARLPASVVAVSGDAADSSPLRDECFSMGFESEVRPFDAVCARGVPDGQSIVVFSDSHGVEISYVLGELAEEYNINVREFTQAACPPVQDYAPKYPPNCGAHIAQTVKGLADETDKSIVILGAFYLDYVRRSDPPFFMTGFEGVVADLRKAGHDVVILGPTQPHPYERPVPQALAMWARAGRSLESYAFDVEVEALDGIDRELRAMASRHDAKYIPLLPLLCEREACPGSFNGRAIYFDDDHMTVETTRYVVRSHIAPVIFSTLD